MLSQIKHAALSMILIITLISCSGTQGKEAPVKSSDKKSTSIPVGLGVGFKAPEVELFSPDGNQLKLSALRGKMVLIDFWASWCPPCRRENPNIVATYREYKSQKFKNGDGFTVFSVSLDKDKSQWLEAIEKDELEWEYHVSELKGWQSVPAALYNVQSIPSSWLIDGDGVIIAKNLRGNALAEALESLKL